VTKTADGSKDLARQFKSRRQIQMLVDDPHARRLALTSWTMNLRPEFRALRLREHAHTFGFTGQLITKSRHCVRRARTTWPHRTCSTRLKGRFVMRVAGTTIPRRPN
jgi:hypothetical protein